MNEELTIDDVIGEVIIDHVMESLEIGDLSDDEVAELLEGDYDA